MVHFKQHAKEEIPLQAPITDSAHPPPDPAKGEDSLKTRSSAYVMSLGGAGAVDSGSTRDSDGKPPVQGDTYKLMFLGKYRIPTSVNTGNDQVEIMDMLVTKVKDSLTARTVTSQSRLGVRRSIGSRLLGKSSKPSPPNSRKSSQGRAGPVDGEGVVNGGMKDVDKQQSTVGKELVRGREQHLKTCSLKVFLVLTL